MTTVLPTKPYTPRHKGKVERGVSACNWGLAFAAEVGPAAALKAFSEVTAVEATAAP